jgi:hypothetical protein
VAFYKGIKIDLNGDVYLPSLAKDIIINKGKPLKEQIEYLNKHLVEFLNLFGSGYARLG